MGKYFFQKKIYGKIFVYKIVIIIIIIEEFDLVFYWKFYLPTFGKFSHVDQVFRKQQTKRKISIYEMLYIRDLIYRKLFKPFDDN